MSPDWRFQCALTVVLVAVHAQTKADNLQLPDALVPQQRGLSVTGRAVSTASGEHADSFEHHAEGTLPGERDGGARDASGNQEPPADRPVPIVIARRETIHADGRRLEDSENPRRRLKVETFARERSPAAEVATKPEHSGRLASALNSAHAPSANPYGDMYDTRGIRPFGPGVRYDQWNHKDRSVLGGLFGGKSLSHRR